MAAQVMLEAEAIVLGRRLAAFVHTARLEVDVVEVDTTTFASGGWKQVAGGLKGGTVNLEGFADFAAEAAGPDPLLGLPAAGSLAALTFVPAQALAQGATAYGLVGMVKTANPLIGKVGEAAGWQANFLPGSRVGRGQISSTGTVTATGQSPVVNLGAIPAGKRLMSQVHVQRTAGTGSIVVAAATATAVGFASPTTRLTHASMVAGYNAETLEADGPIADAFARHTWTVTGTGTFQLTTVLLVS